MYMKLLRPGRLLMLASALAAILMILPASAQEESGQTGTTQNESVDEASLAAHADAVAVVDKLHAALLDAMHHADELGFQGRYARLQPVIASLFDTPLICKVILSRYWDTMDQQQQSDFIALFNKLSTSTYASRFDGYDGQQFRHIGVQELQKGRLLIKTELTRPDDNPVKLDYLMHHDTGSWLIISVIADGVNDLSLKRAEYAVVIRDKGYDGLLADIKNKISKLEKGK
jgi:phospholipid transport system substrate-binding protein